jgi:hypothetical protein
MQKMVVLVGMGMADLSMNPYALLEAKKTIRDMAFESWQSAARTVCDLASPEEMNTLIEREGHYENPIDYSGRVHSYILLVAIIRIQKHGGPL